MTSTAFVLGAGLGTRLRPLTARRPKPLIPVVNKPLITYAFDHLLGAGVQRFVVNTHWRAEAYAAAFPEPSYRGAPLVFRDEQPEILETGGGIWNVRDLLGDGTFIVYNGDILSDLPLEPALRAHRDRGSEVTMILRSHGGPLQVACHAASGRVMDIGGRVDSAAGPRFLFTGIYVVNAEFIRRIPAATKIGVVPIFCDMIREGAKLDGLVIDDGRWWDLGSREQYLAVHEAFAHQPLPAGGWIDPTARIDRAAKLSGATAIGPGAVIGAHASLHGCLVWEGAEIAPGTLLNHCIITDGQRVEGIHSQADF